MFYQLSPRTICVTIYLGVSPDLVGSMVGNQVDRKTSFAVWTWTGKVMKRAPKMKHVCFTILFS